MSVLKNLKSIFIIEDDGGGKEPADKQPGKSKKEQAGEPSFPGKAPENPSPSASSTSGKQDSKIINTLLKAVDRSNLSGFDYLEFKKAVKGLEKMVSDEATRFKSAFATASTMGVTLDKLVETANYYIQVLDKERSQFVEAAHNQTTSLVENRKKEMDLLLKSMSEKKALIDRLTKELAESEHKLKTIQQGIDNAAIKIDQTKKNFDVSFNHLREQITSDIDKMKNYLK
jgi:hypothetical protein